MKTKDRENEKWKKKSSLVQASKVFFIQAKKEKFSLIFEDARETVYVIW